MVHKLFYLTWQIHGERGIADNDLTWKVILDYPDGFNEISRIFMTGRESKRE